MSGFSSPSARKPWCWPLAPKGSFILTMRLYAPRPQALDRGWKPLAVERTEWWRW
jgi:hypothetical protein